MDIYDYLKLDHDHVAELFKQFKDTESYTRKKEIVDYLIQELTAHADSEQETLYKTLLQFETTEEEAEHGQKEHNEILDQIQLILKSKKLDTAWVNKVEKLNDIVHHHVKDEEGPMFKRAKKVLTDEQAYILKEQMHYLKQKLLLKYKK